MKGLVLEIPPFITTSTQTSIQALDNVQALNPLSLSKGVNSTHLIKSSFLVKNQKENTRERN
jgi:hypothetical protein